MKKNIAITYGDPQGIGVEILLKVIELPEFIELQKNVNFVIYGDKNLLSSFSNANKLNNLTIVDIAKFLSSELINDPGHHSFACIQKAIQDAQKGQIHGLVTGPISKENWIKAGYNYKDQTELLGEMFSCNPEMLFLASKNQSNWRVLLLTRHIPLKEVSQRLTFERLHQAVQTLIRFLEVNCKVIKPKIALAGINPHAGENGEIGREEIDYLKDWCEKLEISGPFSPDEIWYKSSQSYMNGLPQAFDAYLAPYHDQVLPLIKTVTNLKAVNTSIGLPIPRTSPDHGTAFNLVGKNLADYQPFWEAIKACIELV